MAAFRRIEDTLRLISWYFVIPLKITFATHVIVTPALIQAVVNSCPIDK